MANLTLPPGTPVRAPTDLSDLSLQSPGSPILQAQPMTPPQPNLPSSSTYCVIPDTQTPSPAPEQATPPDQQRVVSMDGSGAPYRLSTYTQCDWKCER